MVVNMEKVIHRVEWVDDRAACEDCKQLYIKHVVTSHSAADMEKFRKTNHPAVRWMFDVAVVNNEVATVQYTRRACRAKRMEPMPAGLLHRCEAFKPKIDHKINDEGDWWQNESSTQSSASWWDA